MCHYRFEDLKFFYSIALLLSTLINICQTSILALLISSFRKNNIDVPILAVTHSVIVYASILAVQIEFITFRCTEAGNGENLIVERVSTDIFHEGVFIVENSEDGVGPWKGVVVWY